jgi:hypothetical protein
MYTCRQSSLKSQSWVTCQAMQHSANHCRIGHRFAGFRQLFVVLAQPPVASQPSRRLLDHPAAWEHDKPNRLLGTLDHFENPPCQLPDPIDHRLPTTTSICPDQLQAMEALQHSSLEEQFGASPLLGTRLVDNNGQGRAHHIHHDMPLSSFDVLVAVIRALSLHLHGFDAWAVDNRRAGFDFTARFLAHALAQSIVRSFPDTLPAPGMEVAIDCLPGVPLQGLVTLFTYRSLVMQPTTITVPRGPFEITYQRTSMNWNAHASGMIYYVANNPTGATIHGTPDAITIPPPSNWMQFSGVTGTVVSVNRIPVELGGAQSTYYRDNSDVNSNDTGNQCSYGDADFQVQNPNPGDYARLGQTYYLTGATGDVGAIYLDYCDNPLGVSVSVISFALPNRSYLPIILR